MRSGSTINHRNIGHVVGEMMNILWNEYSEDVPPINVFVVNQETEHASYGADDYVKTWCKRRGKKLSAMSDDDVLKLVWKDALKFKQWDEILTLFQINTDIEQQEIDGGIDGDGKDRRRLGYGQVESPEHRKFKHYIASHPQRIDEALKRRGTVEKGFPSLDEVDVFFAKGSRAFVVEVKSQKSLKNFADLKRGVFQCVKYKALAEAEDTLDGKQRTVFPFLAIECSRLNPKIQAMADDLDVKIIKIAKKDVDAWRCPKRLCG